MLKARIHVNLPSHGTERSKTPGEWVRSLFGAKLDLSSGREELTVSAFSLVEGLIEAFTRAGVTDVISFVVDKKVVYVDTRQVSDDLPLVREAAEQKGVFGRKFGEMHLVLSHRADDLHALFDVRIVNQVLLGHDEMTVEISARVESLRIRPGETAEAYAERVRTFLAGERALEPHRLRIEALATRVGDALRTTLVGAQVKVDSAEITLIRPGAAQIARFRELPFGDDVDAPHYRPAPTAHRTGAYADPFYYYYYDPYYDFMTFLMVDSLIHHAHYDAWHPAHMHVVDTHGHELASGADLSAAGDGWVGRDAVSFDENGHAHVADHVAAAADTGPSWSSSASDDAGGGRHDDGGGWGGGDSDGGGIADAGDTSSCSSSSCGSSCSSSSCGSSCGGGCGGGGD